MAWINEQKKNRWASLVFTREYLAMITSCNPCMIATLLVSSTPVRSISQCVTEGGREGRQRKEDRESMYEKKDGVGLLVRPLTFKLSVLTGNAWSEGKKKRGL